MIFEEINQHLPGNDIDFDINTDNESLLNNILKPDEFDFKVKISEKPDNPNKNGGNTQKYIDVDSSLHDFLMTSNSSLDQGANIGKQAAGRSLSLNFAPTMNHSQIDLGTPLSARSDLPMIGESVSNPMNNQALLGTANHNSRMSIIDGMGIGLMQSKPNHDIQPFNQNSGLRRATEPIILPKTPVSATLSLDSMNSDHLHSSQPHSPLVSITETNLLDQMTNLRPKNAPLSISEIKAIFDASISHGNKTRAKRDLAIVCLLLDLHESSGSITRMTFGSIKSIIHSMINQSTGIESLLGHHILVYDPVQQVNNLKRCHPITAWALKNWVSELVFNYSWGFDENLPLFVNSQPIVHEVTGIYSLRQNSLKRDAISKVFQSVRKKAKVQCLKNNISQTSLSVLDSECADIIRKLETSFTD